MPLPQALAVFNPDDADFLEGLALHGSRRTMAGSRRDPRIQKKQKGRSGQCTIAEAPPGLTFIDNFFRVSF
jgi:hypothetical protein